jgi:hypothetical protein
MRTDNTDALSLVNRETFNGSQNSTNAIIREFYFKNLFENAKARFDAKA